ncbi:SDR family NAD(P)-dependent oxidoreductase [Protaetiibacter larvae]|uniref:SDR family oxidoreductase n=1 Tax=Protaetiibacter larvae TaxID=2592654 RepID=A0A5C1Y6I3_9MICO|nr:SDR family NAD(P)-dependent oxidoreductase [Protaetiibacter larvae]QEO09411.1 SDR family oxidoreductase [Protaetiibacter larvae]
MLIDFTDKVVVVTGAGRGIGAGIVTSFAREGATTVALDVGTDDLAAVGAEIEALGGTGIQRRVDVTDAAGVRAVMAEVVERYGRIDVLINNAGIAGNGAVEDLDDATWDRVFDVNVKGILHTCQAVIPTMKRQRSGRIINSASFAAIVPLVGGGLYAASKSAVTQFTRVLAGELGPWDITVNAYAPGMIPTALGRFGDMDPQEQSRYLDTLTLRRWGDAQEVAHLTLFLASDLASYITGTLIDVSGGKLATQRPRLAYERSGIEGGWDLGS